MEPRHADRCLGIIEQRCLAGRTGATWQAETVHLLERRGRLDRDAALRRMTQRYIEHMHTNEPVHSGRPVTDPGARPRTNGGRGGTFGVTAAGGCRGHNDGRSGVCTAARTAEVA